MVERQTAMASNMQLTDWCYFAFFAVLPGLLYQWIQDHGRALEQNSATIDYLFGVAPNTLGGLSLCTGLALLGKFRFKSWSSAKVSATAAAAALLGLLGWEALQRWLPNGFFDWHDMLWTAPGVVAGFCCAQIWQRFRQ